MDAWAYNIAGDIIYIYIMDILFRISGYLKPEMGFGSNRLALQNAWSSKKTQTQIVGHLVTQFGFEPKWDGYSTNGIYAVSVR